MQRRRPAFVPNGIGHFDIAGPDVGILARFYASVFGWAVAERGPGYTSVETPEGTPNGAIVESDEAAFTIGIVVPDLAGAIDHAVAAGGSVVLPPTDNGWVTKAQVLDPAGNRLTLIAGG